MKKNCTSRCLLISGAPGIGKTSTVKLVSERLNYVPIITNASDKRSAKALKSSDILEIVKGNKIFKGNKIIERPMLIFDEVDGMSGGDRGGIQQMINFIRATKVPIICICNDRNCQKIRSLGTHC